MSDDSPIIITMSNDGTEVFGKIAVERTLGIPVSSEQVLYALEDAGARDFAIDYLGVDRLIDSQNQGGNISVPLARKLDGMAEIEVSKDEMEAFVIVREPKGGKAMEVDDVLTSLAAKGVKEGVKQDVIENIILTQWFNEKVLVAEGIQPQDGSDGAVEMLFDLEETGPKPTIDEEDVVNYKELNLVKNVSKNEALARKVPPTEGKPGKTVTGHEIPARPGKDVGLPMGKNTSPSEKDPNLLVSLIDGQPRLQQNKIHVYPVYEVPGDVDYSTGNISFVGDITVKGGVLEGFTVNAEGDIAVMGPVSGCNLKAGGNVILNKGMHGQDKGTLVAGGDVTAKFLEHTTVKAGGNILVSDGLIGSIVVARKNVQSMGKKGFIVGGRVSAGEEVEAKVIGNSLATPTEIEVGGNPKIREELRQIEDQRKALKLNQERTEKGVKSLKQAKESGGGTLPQDKEDLLLQLTRAQFHLMSQLKKLETREEELEEILASSFRGKVIVREVIYPGVKLIIKQAVLYVRDTIRATAFYEQDGEIHIGPI